MRQTVAELSKVPVQQSGGNRSGVVQERAVFQDQRQQAGVQRQRNLDLNNSVQVRQLKAQAQLMQDSSRSLQFKAQLGPLRSGGGVVQQTSAVIQRATRIRHWTGAVDVKGGQYPVGRMMVAELDADDPITGSATGPNWPWMQALRGMYPAANVVRGHLLNHDLGGYAVPANLYPISTLANADHSAKVEQPVKAALYAHKGTHTNKPQVVYTVEVLEAKAGDPEDAAFKCKWEDAQTGALLGSDVIKSNLAKDSGGFGGGGKKVAPPPGWYHGKRRGDEDWSNVLKGGKIGVSGYAGGMDMDESSAILLRSLEYTFDFDGSVDMDNVLEACAGQKPEKYMQKILDLGYVWNTDFKWA